MNTWSYPSRLPPCLKSHSYPVSTRQHLHSFSILLESCLSPLTFALPTHGCVWFSEWPSLSYFVASKDMWILLPEAPHPPSCIVTWKTPFFHQDWAQMPSCLCGPRWLLFPPLPPPQPWPQSPTHFGHVPLNTLPYINIVSTLSLDSLLHESRSYNLLIFIFPACSMKKLGRAVCSGLNPQDWPQRITAKVPWGCLPEFCKLGSVPV